MVRRPRGKCGQHSIDRAILLEEQFPYPGRRERACHLHHELPATPCRPRCASRLLRSSVAGRISRNSLHSLFGDGAALAPAGDAAAGVLLQAFHSSRSERQLMASSATRSRQRRVATFAMHARLRPRLQAARVSLPRWTGLVFMRQSVDERLDSESMHHGLKVV